MDAEFGGSTKSLSLVQIGLPMNIVYVGPMYKVFAERRNRLTLLPLAYMSEKNHNHDIEGNTEIW
jgi:hypothetical protein